MRGMENNNNTKTHRIVGATAGDNPESVHVDSIDADTFDVWTVDTEITISTGEGILDEWVENFPTLEAAQAAYPDAELALS